MTFELTISGDMEKYDQWQKKLVPVLEQLATKSGEEFMVASVTQDLYLTTALSNMLVENEYFPRQRMLSDQAFLKSCAGFRSGAFNGGGDYKFTLLVNTGRNKLNDRTTWKWFTLPPTCVETACAARRVKVEASFLDKNGDEVVKDVLEWPLLGRDPANGVRRSSPGLLIENACFGRTCEPILFTRRVAWRLLVGRFCR